MLSQSFYWRSIIVCANDVMYVPKPFSVMKSNAYLIVFVA